MVIFVFALSCVVFITTVTWLSYQLAEAKALNPVSAGAVGFFLSLMPPMGLLYIAYLAYRSEPKRF